MAYEILLLDSDNTLMDFDAAQEYALERLLGKYGCPCTAETRAAYEVINSGLWEEFNRGGLDKQTLLLCRFQLFFEQQGLPKADYREVNRSYLEYLGECAELLPGALEFCREMSREAELYVLTNGVSQVQRKRFAASPLREYVRAVFISEETGWQKPQAEYFSFVFAQIEGFEKERAIMIGDSLSSDIAGANNAGIASCWYNPQAVPLPESIHCDYIATDYEQLRRIVREGKAACTFP